MDSLGSDNVDGDDFGLSEKDDNRIPYSFHEVEVGDYYKKDLHSVEEEGCYNKGGLKYVLTLFQREQYFRVVGSLVVANARMQ